MLGFFWDNGERRKTKIWKDGGLNQPLILLKINLCDTKDRLTHLL